MKKCFFCFTIKDDHAFDKPLKGWILPVCRECEVSLCQKGTSERARKDHLKRYLRPDVYLYVVQSIMGGPIKIGVSKAVERRIKELQGGSPFKLVAVRIIGKIPSILERRIHKQLTEYKLHGEWFKEESLELLDKLIENMLVGD